ncbi:MAG TPA: hypothetical protein VG893_09385 [Terracidiphilus sp.]|nr:hypothetical protein [Terracidiphilus sp.]
MKPETIGRVFGTGMRVAGRMAAQRLAASGAPAQPSQPRAASGSGGSLGQGVRRGAAGFFKPIGRASSIVWLQVTGVFFFLPVLVFAPTVWRTRMSYAHGPDHRAFLASAIVVAVFFYLGVTSFWRARKK